MSEMPVKNLSASILQRLLNLSRQRGETYDLTLTRYASERFLYRLSQSRHREKLILKGAALCSVWMPDAYRPTRDVDFLGLGEDSEGAVKDIIMDVCRESVPDDGVIFDGGSIRIARIRDDNAYGGRRVKFQARLGRTCIPVQLDVGFGDAITPELQKIDYPTLLEFPAPHLMAYPRETVVAEKFQAMVALGVANSRMKDFYDLWMMARTFPFDGPTLTLAIANTFARRRTPIPRETPLVLTEEFATDRNATVQWGAFLERADLLSRATDFAHLIPDLAAFLLPPMLVAAHSSDPLQTWFAGGPWTHAV
jgi:predicted nucleotidyltransferase component of viral defense system